MIQQIAQLTKSRSLLDEYNSVKSTNQQAGFENFARHVALAVAAVLKNNIRLIEEVCNAMEANETVNQLRKCVFEGLTYLVQLTNIPEEELFKILIEFWNFFSYDCYQRRTGFTYG